MFRFPTDPKKIKALIARYQRELRNEAKKFGSIHDGYGKRYLLGPLYLLLGDLPGALQSFEWFERAFPSDMGEPLHYLCWTLALYRSGNLAGASRKLLQTALSNLYLVPYLLSGKPSKLNVWHRTNVAEKEYLQEIPGEIWALWDTPAMQWTKEEFESPEFCRICSRYIEICEELEDLRPGPRRSQLVVEASGLRGFAVRV